EVARNSGYKLDQEAPLARVDELPNYDGIIIGVGTGYGRMASRMANFLDHRRALVEWRAGGEGRLGLFLNGYPAWWPRNDPHGDPHQSHALRHGLCRPAL